MLLLHLAQSYASATCTYDKHFVLLFDEPALRLLLGCVLLPFPSCRHPTKNDNQRCIQQAGCLYRHSASVKLADFTLILLCSSL